MTEPGGAERLVFFTDAVVAIAITLLVLPLVDAVGEAVDAGRSATEVITGNLGQFFSFLLSFAVIARLWSAHHRLFDGVTTASRRVVGLNMLWLLTIVVLPFPTEMIGGYGEDWFTAVLYIGSILASSACLTALSVAIRGRLVGGAGSMTALLALALLVAAFVPGVRYLALLLLFLAPLVERLWQRWRPDYWAA
ncbi:putative membrane protein [Pseudonocardia hierapolitana]|uniref:Putative membrane protein n=1 Tax=Pseudonocardia hierapolitana TaxID=1128676 RepID=A0A561T215_9PSEU|nr:TMEM175 family protein [Pseudonocardia hierapolitana]TWF81158.1 putative membrane protein [Pseudonocardia hierapolitana]